MMLISGLQLRWVEIVCGRWTYGHRYQPKGQFAALLIRRTFQQYCCFTAGSVAFWSADFAEVKEHIYALKSNLWQMQRLCGSLLYDLLLEKTYFQRWLRCPSSVKFLCSQKFSKMCLGHKTSGIIVESWINMSTTTNLRSICSEATKFLLFISLYTWNPAWQ